ncbi:MAG: hypothetical protein RBS17_05075 [Coriobacteriia bacterium]|nr:hypothetical protein [Coriobacteriia bacterium]
MDERTASSDWRVLDRRHRAGIALGAAAVSAVIVVGAVVLSGGESAVPEGEASRRITPAEQTVESTAPVASYEVTTSEESSSIPEPESTGSDAYPAPMRVAYRRDGWLCVAALDGSGERRVAESESGVFSLSPDGATIASVDADGHLRLYDVVTDDARDLGPVERERPSWSPDSGAIVYTAPGPVVRRHSCNGGRQTVLCEGRAPVFARDGATVIAISPDSRDPATLVWRDGRLERRATSAPVTSIVCTASRIYIGTGPGGSGQATLRSMSLGGTDERIEVRSAEGARGVSIGSLSVSPDGVWVVYAEHGDDGSSRVYVVPADGGVPVQISGRRDSYPLQWAEADALLLIEGNSMQGESTSLVSVSVTSGARRLVVQGADR